jgi:hypothetical protein
MSEYFSSRVQNLHARFPPVLRRTLTLLIRSHDQVHNLQYMTQIELYIHHQTHPTRTPNSKQPCLPPLILARSRVSQQWTSVIHVIYIALPPSVVTVMNSLPQNIRRAVKSSPTPAEVSVFLSVLNFHREKCSY